MSRVACLIWRNIGEWPGLRRVLVVCVVLWECRLGVGEARGRRLIKETTLCGLQKRVEKR